MKKGFLNKSYNLRDVDVANRRNNLLALQFDKSKTVFKTIRKALKKVNNLIQTCLGSMTATCF